MLNVLLSLANVWGGMGREAGGCGYINEKRAKKPAERKKEGRKRMKREARMAQLYIVHVACVADVCYMYQGTYTVGCFVPSTCIALHINLAPQYLIIIGDAI